MNKKVKKTIQTLQKRIQKLKLQLAGARRHSDEASETAQLARELAAAEEQLAKLRDS